MSEPRFDSLYTAWATIAGGTGYDSTYSAMKAALEKVTGQENYDSVYSIAVDLADDVEAGSASVAKNTQLNEEITENGTYTFTPDEGYVYDSVTVSVDAGSKAEGTIKIVNNGTYDVTSYAQANVAVGGEGKPQIPNGFRFNGGSLANVDWSAYDWSRIYDTTSFFAGTNNTIAGWDNFNQGFNGSILTCKRLFQNYRGIYLPTVLDCKDAMDFEECFYYNNSENWEAIDTWDFSNAVNFRSMFQGSNITTVPIISAPNVTNMSTMFSGCSRLVDMSNINQYSLTNVVDMSGMFSGCTNLTEVPSLTLMNLSEVKMDTMFAGCTNLTDVSSLTLTDLLDISMQHMFYNCKSIQSTPTISNGEKVDCKGMFYGCTNLRSVDISNIKPINVTGMFHGCFALPDVGFISTWDLSNVSSLSGIFALCSGITSIPSIETSHITAFGGSSRYDGMCGNCDSLETIGEIDLSSATNISYMFYECYKLKEVRFKGNPSNVTNLFASFYRAGLNVEGGSTLYYDSKYDYSNIINELPSTWTAVPYDVVE